MWSSGGGLIWRSQVGANPIPIPRPTNLALFGHKITLYRFNQGAHTIAGGSNWSRGTEPPGPHHFNHWVKISDVDYEQANIDWKEMNGRSDSHDSDWPVLICFFVCFDSSLAETELTALMIAVAPLYDSTINAINRIWLLLQMQVNGFDLDCYCTCSRKTVPYLRK